MQEFRQVLLKIDNKLAFSEKNTRYLLIASCVAVFLLLFLFNHMLQMGGDDYLYSYVYGSTARIQSLGDIFRSLHQHYFEWGGRIVAHFFAYTLLTLPAWVADLFNSFVYLLTMLLIYWHIKGCSKKHSVSIFLLINLLMFFIQPVFAQCVLWITGSCNYLWCIFWILLFLLPYRLYNGDNKSRQLLKCISMFCLGLIAGWTNENTAFAMIVMSFFWIYSFKRSKWKIPAWAIVGLVAAVVGYLLLVLAPGNYVRTGETYVDKRLFVYYWKFMITTEAYLHLLGSLDAGIFILFCLSYSTNKKMLKKNLPELIIYFLGTLISVYVMLAAPSFPYRAFFGAIIFNIIAFGILLFNLNYAYIYTRYIKRGLLFFASIAFIFSFYFGYKDLNRTNKVWQAQQLAIEKAKSCGDKSVSLQSFMNETKYAVNQPSGYAVVMSSYYGINISFTPPVYVNNHFDAAEDLW